MKSLTLLALVLCIGVALGTSTLDLLNGTFNFINSTDLTAGTPSYNNGPKGGIIYAPAYPGATFGNMSVNFGDNDSFVAYLGPYVVFPDNGTVIHYPVISSNAKAPAGSTVIRRFTFEDSTSLFFLLDGNYLFLITDPATATNGHTSLVVWKRAFPLASTDSCSAQVSLIPRSGSSWYSNGQNNQILFAGASITQSWNLQSQGGSIYSTTDSSSYAVGATSTDAGFVLTGTNLSPSISLYSISC